jgi:hypothetical protein
VADVGIDSLPSSFSCNPPLPYLLVDDDTKNKYGLTKWNIFHRPKDQGGLGIEVLGLKNKCLLRKWILNF